MRVSFDLYSLEIHCMVYVPKVQMYNANQFQRNHEVENHCKTYTWVTWQQCTVVYIIYWHSQNIIHLYMHCNGASKNYQHLAYEIQQ